MHHYSENDEFLAGLKNLQDKAWKDAVAHFTKVIDAYGYEAPDVFLKRGLALLRLGSWDKAIEDFKTAIHLGVDNAEAFASLASSYRLKGWWDEAIHFWGAALERNGENAEYFFRRGLAYFDKGWFNEAIEHFLAAAQIDPAEPRIPYATAVALACRGQADEAKRFLSKAVEMGGEAFQSMYEKYPHAAEITEKMMAAFGIKAPAKAAAPEAPAPKAPAKAPAKAAAPEAPVDEPTVAAKPEAKKTPAKKEAAKKPAAKKAPAKKDGEKKPAAKKAPAKAAKRTATKQDADGGSMLDAAYKILETAGQPLHYKDITREALAQQLIKTGGATPEQSMRSAISREISSRGAGARFKQDDKKKGFYRLTYWDREA